MTIPYTDITTYEGSDMDDFLTKIRLVHIFESVFKEYPDKSISKLVIRYIVYAYSVNSEMIIFGDAWLKNKQRILEACYLPPEKRYYEDLVHLKSDGVKEAIRRWIDHQDNDTWTELCMLKDLRVQMQLAATSDITKSSGEIDYDQKFKNAKYSNDLSQMIKDKEAELIQNNPQLKEAVKEFRQHKVEKVTIGAEHFAQ